MGTDRRTDGPDRGGGAAPGAAGAETRGGEPGDGRAAGPGEGRGRGDPPTRFALGLVFLTVVIDLVGFGIVLPLIPFYASELGAGPTAVGAIIASYSAMQFLLAPAWGRLSDRVGRRPVLLVGLAGSGASYVLFGLAETVAVLLLSRVVAGAMGANVAVAQAYVADTTSGGQRARGMGLIGAAFGLGFVAGPAMGGILSQWGYGVPGFAAAGLSLAAAAVAFFALPESLPEAARTAGVGDGGDSAGVLSAVRLRVSRLAGSLAAPELRDPIGAAFVGTLAFAAFTTTFPLLLQGPMGMTSVHAGWFFAYVGLLTAAVQGGLLGPVVDRLGERRTALVGALVFAAGLGSLAWLDGTSGLLVALGGVGLGWGYVNPSLQSLISRRAGDDAQGGVLGVNQSAASLARVVGPPAGGWVFGALGFRVEFLATAAVAAAAAAWILAMAGGPAEGGAAGG